MYRSDWSRRCSQLARNFATGPASSASTITGLSRYTLSIASDNFRMDSSLNASPAHLFGGVEAAIDARSSLANSAALGSAYLSLARQEAFGTSWTAPVGPAKFSAIGVYGRQLSSPGELPIDGFDIGRTPGTSPVFGFAGRTTIETNQFTAGIHAGVVREAGTVLGAAADGAFSLPGGALTRFAGFTLETTLPLGITLFGAAEAGRTETGHDATSLIGGFENLVTTAYHLGLAKAGIVGQSDQLSLIVSQPMRLERGQVALNLPTARDLEGNVNFTSTNSPVAASGREIDLQIGYGADLGYGQTLYASGLLRLQPDNIRDAETSKVALLKYRLSF